jgi:hypothetical protein
MMMMRLHPNNIINYEFLALFGKYKYYLCLPNKINICSEIGMSCKRQSWVIATVCAADIAAAIDVANTGNIAVSLFRCVVACASGCNATWRTSKTY